MDAATSDGIIEVGLKKLEVKDEDKHQSQIPVTILSGFLGSGKTTLLNYILKDPFHGLRIAVIENEYGEALGLEKLIISDQGKDNLADEKEELPFYELSNGCICCTVRDNFVETLERLVNMPGKRFDYIVVETTGMANAGAVASSFWVDDELEGKLVLDGIVTLIDAKNLNFHLNVIDDLETQARIEAQIAFADRILINKSDLVPSEEERQTIEDLVRKRTHVPLVWTEHSKCDLKHILNIRAFDKGRAQDIETELSQARVSTEANPNQVRTICITESRTIDLEKLNHWVGTCLWEDDRAHFGTIFRIKGIVSIVNEDFKFIIQAVHDLFEIVPTNEVWEHSTTRETKIVFIGIGFDPSVLQSGLSKCCNDK